MKTSQKRHSKADVNMLIGLIVTHEIMNQILRKRFGVYYKLVKVKKE